MRYSVIIFVLMLWGCGEDNPVELTTVKTKVDYNQTNTIRKILLESFDHGSHWGASGHYTLDTIYLSGFNTDTVFAFYNQRANKYYLRMDDNTNYPDTFQLRLGLTNRVHFKFKEN